MNTSNDNCPTPTKRNEFANHPVAIPQHSHKRVVAVAITQPKDPSLSLALLSEHRKSRPPWRRCCPRVSQVDTPDNYHSDESKSSNSGSSSAQTTSNYKHNNISSRNENECQKVSTFAKTTPMFLNVTNPANSHSNESASIKSASYSTNHIRGRDIPLAI